MRRLDLDGYHLWLYAEPSGDVAGLIERQRDGRVLPFAMRLPARPSTVDIESRLQRSLRRPFVRHWEAVGLPRSTFYAWRTDHLWADHDAGEQYHLMRLDGYLRE